VKAIDDVLAKSVECGDLPFAVAMVSNAKGVTYSGAAGEAAPGRKAGEDTVFRIFSMTKAIGATAAMILIDRGKLDPDTPVKAILPEFGMIQVLKSLDGNKPVFRLPKSPATVRQLATHTSGLDYQFWNADMAKFMSKSGHPSVMSGQKNALIHPMMRDPGTRWGYGSGIDWLGLVVEKVDGRRIDQFCHDEIFAPLGMNATAFEVSDDLKPRLAALSARRKDGTFGPYTLELPSKPEVYGMGHALYATAPDYMKFLRMILNRGVLDGNRILSEDGLAFMLADQMKGLAFEKMRTVMPAMTADFDPFPGTRCTHSFAFLRNEADIPGRRAAGSQTWAGVLNTHYWLDPKTGIAAVLMTQSMPFAEPRCMQVYEEFERAVYARA